MHSRALVAMVCVVRRKNVFFMLLLDRQGATSPRQPAALDPDERTYRPLMTYLTFQMQETVYRVGKKQSSEAGAATSGESDGQRRGAASGGGVAHGGGGAQKWGSYWKGWPPAAGAAVSGVGAARRWTRRNPPPRAIMNTFTVPAPAATDARGAVLTPACPAFAPPSPPRHAGASRRCHPPPPSTRNADPPLLPKKRLTRLIFLLPLPLPRPLLLACGWRPGGGGGAAASATAAGSSLSPARGAGRRLWSGKRPVLNFSGRWGLRGGGTVRRWGRQAKAR